MKRAKERYAHICIYCLMELMSRGENPMYRLAGCDDEVQRDDDDLATCEFCGDKIDEVFLVK